MNGKIVAFDFSGTIIRKDIAKEASNRRFKSLGKEVDQDWLEKALATNEHYGIINDIISKVTGVKDNDKLTIMSTNFFKFHMFVIANERKEDIFQEGILKLIEDLKKKAYKVAIVSGTRTDIIEGVLEILGKRSLFDYICGQPPQLGISNEELLKQLQDKGEVIFVIGDKIGDINAGKAIKAGTVFVTWGHPTGEEEKKADFIVKHPSEIIEIVNAYKEIEEENGKE